MGFELRSQTASLYDDILCPVLFEPFAVSLIQRMPTLNAGRALEIACGTGALSKHLPSHFGVDVRLAISDRQANMLRLAKLKNVLPQAFLADFEHLPVRPGSLDWIAFGFGLMFAQNPPRALQELARATRPGGCLGFSTWAPIDRNPWAEAVHSTVRTLVPESELPHIERPFSFGDVDRIRTLLLDSEFGDVEIGEECKSLHGGDPCRLALGLIAGNPLGDVLKARGYSLEPLIEALAKRLDQKYGNPVLTTMTAVIATARRASPS